MVNTYDGNSRGARNLTNGNGRVTSPSSVPAKPAAPVLFRIALAVEDKGLYEQLQAGLARLGLPVVAAASDGQAAAMAVPVGADLLITDRLDSGAALPPHHPAIPSLLVAGQQDGILLDTLEAQESLMGLLVKPIGDLDLKLAIRLAVARFRQLASLSKEVVELRQALEDRKLIERAKGILMRRVKVDEEEAFRRLRMVASEQNLKLIEVSRRLLNAEEMFVRFDKI